jgi:energy-coupling factor transporter transmembrane protein EcfT
MESRAWGATKKRTNLYSLKLHRGDFALLVMNVAVLAVAIYVRLYVPVPSLSQLFLV